MSAPVRVAFIGLGVMGGPMAGHLAKAGHHVTVYNRNPEKSKAWAAEHASLKISIAGSPKEAARDSEFIFSCVGTDDDLADVTIGEHGAFSAMKKNAVFVDHTTASAEIARTLGAKATASGVHFLDAPVSGGQAGAVNGTLTIMVGGDKKASERAKPVAMAYAKAFTHVGKNGTGQLAKMVNQICVAGVIEALAEGVAFGRRAGLDMGLVLEIIGKGAAQSWQMENRGPTMLENKFDFGFAVDWMRKDLGLCMAEAKKIGAALPVTALIDQFYSDIQRMGGQRWDTSSLIKRLL